MKPLLIILILFCIWVKVAAYVPPELPANLPCGILFSLDNETLAAFADWKTSSDDTNNPNIAATTPWGNEPKGGPLAWPRDPKFGNHVVIPYCYRTKEDRDTLRPIIIGALNSTDGWYAALRGYQCDGDNCENGYDVQFVEWVDFVGEPKHAEPMYCTVADGDGRDKPKWGWNPRLPFDTVAVSYQAQMTSESAEGTSVTVGLHRKNPPEPYLNQWIMGKTYVPNVIHALGHLMGMVHEHQRPDRDRYMKYECKYLQYFQQILNYARSKEDRAISEQEFCTSYQLQAKYNFVGGNFLRGDVMDFPGAWTTRAESDYDPESIMHYSVGAFAGEKCGDRGYTNECPLLQWIDPDDHSKGTMLYLSGMDIGYPSALDCEWVRKTYPPLNTTQAGIGVMGMGGEGEEELLEQLLIMDGMAQAPW